MKTEYTLKTGATLFLSDACLEHLGAHPEITEQILTAGAVMSVPPTDSITANIVDLYEFFGNWAMSGLVEVKTANLFAFRKDRPVPSSVTKLDSKPASKLALIMKPEIGGNSTLITAYCTDGFNVGPEPISPSINPHTDEGQQQRQTAVSNWGKYALSLACTPIDGEPFESTWLEIIAKYGNYYHPLD